jgi:DNA-binding protein H-NS
VEVEQVLFTQPQQQQQELQIQVAEAVEVYHHLFNQMDQEVQDL